MIPLVPSHTPGRFSPRKRILFVCSGNACRSQMAEGWARKLYGDQIDAYSAGVETNGLDPKAVLVMAEAGVDLSRHHSKALPALSALHFDLIVTLSDRAASHIRHLPLSDTQTAIHLPVLSPAKRQQIGDSSLLHYRALRDELRRLVTRLVQGQASYRAQAIAV